jgi:hypothetical protein
MSSFLSCPASFMVMIDGCMDLVCYYVFALNGCMSIGNV